jgi:ribosomal protein S4
MRRETKKGKEKREIGQQKEEKTKQTYIQSRNNNELESSLNTLLIRQTTQLTLKTVFLLYCRTQTLQIFVYVIYVCIDQLKNL